MRDDTKAMGFFIKRCLSPSGSRSRLVGKFPNLKDFKPDYRDFRAGDVMHSQADISKAARLVGYETTYSIAAGLDEALAWYVESVNA